MTSPSTITERVAEMHAARAAEPPGEAMGDSLAAVGGGREMNDVRGQA